MNTKSMANTPARQHQMAFLNQKMAELSKKAKLASIPELNISKSERLANVNVYRDRISIGENLLLHWEKGEFTDADMEATLAHEFGHLIDFRNDSHSSSFRNLIAESLWVSLGVLPIVLYVLSPKVVTLIASLLLAVAWACSLPLVMRHIEVKIEFEADRNAALYLVEPQQLADALMKISTFASCTKGFGVARRLNCFVANLTHPSFSERVKYLKSL
jgi:hypothetical protein